MLHVDDQLRLSTFIELTQLPSAPVVSELSPRSHALLRMLVVSLADSVLGRSEWANVDLQAAADLVWQHPQVLAETVELMTLLRGRVDHVHTPLLSKPDIPLLVHASYTRNEILAAMHDRDDRAKTRHMLEGVHWMPKQNTDMFLITFDKSPDRFSPTTRYRDYAISRDVIHWESQGRTSGESPTGKRYRNHVSEGSSVYLFARMSDESKAFRFLGPAAYVSHEGDRPMAITWRLDVPLSGDMYSDYAAAAVA